VHVVVVGEHVVGVCKHMVAEPQLLYHSQYSVAQGGRGGIIFYWCPGGL